MRGEQQTHGADWYSLGEASLYRKWCIYDMLWDADSFSDEYILENFRMCGSSHGGPLAMISNPALRANSNDSVSKGLGGTASSSSGSRLLMYTSSGSLISSTDWSATKMLSEIAGMGWSDHEQLVTVLTSGRVQIYDIHCKLVRDFSLFENPANVGSSGSVRSDADAEGASRGGVIEVHFWPDGLVALVGDMQCIVAEGLANPNPAVNPRIYALETSLHPVTNPYTAMAIVPPLLSRSGLLEVMLGTTDNSILVVDENEVEDQLLQDRISAPITKMAVAPNGHFLACYRRDGIMTVLSSAFTNKVLDFNTKSMSRPMEIAWCGDDAVVLQWKNTGIIMVGPYGDWVNFPYRGVVHLVSEPDCCRVITHSSCDMLQRVPQATEAIRRIGSTDPAALMYDAMEAFEEGDPKSDENIRSIAASNQLVDAISACVTAASTEFDIARQKSLLKAAAYGKTFCSEVDPSEFVETAKKLRVLNEVRRPEVGMPLTINQYNRLTPEVLIGRLTMRNLHFLALKICDLLQVRNERVLIHWAAEKVKRLASTSASDEQITKEIREKLQATSTQISFLEVAASAYHMGRRRLATMILDMEKNAADQVPLLLSMGEEELALRKAINSQDTDLIYLVLMHLEKSCPNVETYHKLVHAHAEAANLLKMYYRNKVTPTDRSVLHNLLMYHKNFLEAGAAAVQQAYMQPTLVAKVQLIKEASSLFGQGRDLGFLKSTTDEQLELMEFQKSLEIRAHRDFIGLSLSETLNNMTLLGLEFPTDAALWEREVQKIVKKFKIPDKQLWHIKIHCFSSTGHWGELAKLAAEKKSPVGYKPFAQACMKYNQPTSETEKYIEKIAVPEDRFDMLFEIESWRQAADVARQLGDADRLTLVMQRCKDETLKRQIMHIIEKL